MLTAVVFLLPPINTEAAEPEPWDGTTVATAFASGSGDPRDPYLVSTAAELAYLAQQINNGGINLGSSIKLTADIDLGGKEWTPIASESSGKIFRGTFDGDGHTISGLHISNGSSKYAGLFGHCRETSTIQNLTVKDSQIAGAKQVGAVAGIAGNISNCRSVDNIISGTSIVGGICGEATGNISECYNNSAVSGKIRIGGILGASNFVDPRTLEKCYNAGTITVQNTAGYLIGGIGGSANRYNVENCLNTGEIVGDSSSSKIGGLFGYFKGTETTTASGCVNRGAVNCGMSYNNESVGAIIGELEGDAAYITNCYYNSDTVGYGKRGIGSIAGEAEGVTPVRTWELCSETLPTGLDDTAWTPGSTDSNITIDGDNSDFGTQNVTYIGLNSVGETETVDLPVYNYGTDAAPDWDTYILIAKEVDFYDIDWTEEDIEWKIESNKNYVLDADFDLSYESETAQLDIPPIGSDTDRYRGKFSGNGHTISGLKIERSDTKYIGFFGDCGEGSVIKNLTVSHSTFTGENFVGAVAGRISGSLMDCKSIDNTVSGNWIVGGVCGRASWDVTGCYNNSTVNGVDRVGGIFGECIDKERTIEKCYNEGKISATGEIDGPYGVGGIGGNVYNHTVKNCLNTGEVSTDDKPVGGLFGYVNYANLVSQCVNLGTINSGQSTKIGAVIADSYSAVIAPAACYYNSDTIGAEVSDAAALTTGQLCNGLPDGLDGSVWKAGTIENRTVIEGRYGKGEGTYIGLDSMGTAKSAGEVPLYNFGREGNDNWQPYTEISTAEELIALANDSTKWTEGNNFVLKNDIDLAGREITPIGSLATISFSGRFSGDGHTIKNVTINQPEESEAGLFGTLADAGEILYLSVSGDITGGDETGGICGINTDGGSIYGCSFAGTVTGTRNVGGICGKIQQGAKIENCYNTATVKGSSNVGGICGRNDQGTVKYCYNIGEVSMGEASGGICGYSDADGSFTNCYYNSDICSKNGENVKGTAGYSTYELTSSDILSRMGFDTAIWTKQANDKENGIACYPSLVTQEDVPSVNFTTELVFERTDDDEIVYGDLIKFDKKALVHFGENISAEDTGGRFTLRKEEEILEEEEADAAYKRTFSYRTQGAGNMTFTLVYAGGDSSFFSEETTKDIAIVVGKIDTYAHMLVYTEPSDLKYDGTAKSAVFNVRTGTSGVGDVTVKYYRDGVETEPVLPGEYTMKLDITEGENCRAASDLTDEKWKFTITKGVLRADLFDFRLPENVAYDGQEKTVTVTAKDGVEGVGEVFGVHYYAEDGTEQQAPVEPGEGIRTVRIDVAEGEYYEAASALGGDNWTIRVEKAVPTAEDYTFLPPKEPVYTGEAFQADFERKNEKAGAVTEKRYYIDGVETEPVIPGTYTVKIDVEETDHYKEAWGVTSEEWNFTIAPAVLTAEGSGTARGTYGDTLSRLTVSGPAVRFGEQEVPGVWTLSGDTIPEVGDDGTYTAVFIPEEHPEYYQPLTAEVTLEIAKADAPVIPDLPVAYSWASSGERAVPVSGLPQKPGDVGDWSVALEGDTGILAADSEVKYSDGKLFFTLGENTEENIGNAVVLTVTLPTRNYQDMVFKVIVALTERGEQQAPDPAAFDLVVTGSGENLTVELVTELEGAEYSFDGVNWSTEKTTTVGHRQSVTGYVRFRETEELNAGPSTSRTVNSGHGTLTHHDRVEPTCIQEGSIEYFSCDVCELYFTDEGGAAEITPAATVLAQTSHTAGEAVRENEIPAACTEEGSYDEVVYCTVCHEKCSTEHKTVPATGHDWSEELTADATGHWHQCKTCGTAGYVEQHISGGAATEDRAETCTVCGYEIAPKKIEDNNGEDKGGNTSDNNGGGNGGTTPDDNGGSNGGGTTPDNNGGGNGGDTTPDNNGGNNNGTTTPDNNGGGSGGGTTPDNNGGNNSGGTTPDNNGGNNGDTTPDDNGENNNGNASDNNGGNSSGTTPDNNGGSNSGTAPDNNGGSNSSNTSDNNGESNNGNTTDSNGGSSTNTAADSGTTAKADNSGAGNRNEAGAGAGGNIQTSANPEIDGKAKSWSAIAKDLIAMEKGDKTTIQLNGSYNVPASVIQTIADKGIQATFLINDHISWTIDGTKIQTPAAASLKVTTIHSLDTVGLRGTEGMQFRMGTTNQPTELTVSFQKENADRFANLYRKDEDGLVFVDNVKIDEMGYARGLKVTEKGSYVIMLCDFSDRAGDVDNDGIVTEEDASAILEQLVEIGDAENGEMLDYNGDGRINALDAAKLLQDLAAGQM